MALTCKKDIVQALGRKTDPTSDFDLNNVPSPQPAAKTSAAVLIGITPGPNGLEVILTKRAAHLAAHPGQVAFPGGKQDGTDGDIIETALREAEEEIGLPQTHIEILGQLPPHDTVTGFHVIPVVAWIEGDWTPKIDPGEVAEVFHVPLQHLLNLQNYSVQSRVWRGAPRFYFTVPYGPYYIWGATARILRAFVDRF